MSKNNIVPMGSRVLVEIPEQSDMTKSGIYLPESAKTEKASRGFVIAVGDGKLADDGSRLPVSVSVGDEVLFSQYSTEEVEVDDKKYLIVDDSSIIAKLTS